MHLDEQVTQPSDPSYRIIPLTQGQQAFVSAEDYERVNQFKWFAYWNRSTKAFYAGRMSRPGEAPTRRIIIMGRFILGITDPAILVDHRNHRTLDNRRTNLRKANRVQNAINRKKASNKSSRAIGVTFHKRDQKWSAFIKVAGKMTYLGYYKTEDEAIAARRAAEPKHHGEFAVTASMENGDTIKGESNA